MQCSENQSRRTKCSNLQCIIYLEHLPLICTWKCFSFWKGRYWRLNPIAQQANLNTNRRVCLALSAILNCSWFREVRDVYYKDTGGSLRQKLSAGSIGPQHHLLPRSGGKHYQQCLGWPLWPLPVTASLPEYPFHTFNTILRDRERKGDNWGMAQVRGLRGWS